MTKQTCESIREEILASDGVMPGHVETHCRECAACAALAALWLKSRTVVVPSREIPPGMDNRIRLAARAGMRRRKNRYHWYHWGAAAALLLLSVSGVLLLQRPLAEPVSVAVESQERYVAGWDWTAFEQESMDLNATLALGSLSLMD